MMDVQNDCHQCFSWRQYTVNAAVEKNLKCHAVVPSAVLASPYAAVEKRKISLAEALVVKP